MKIKILVLLNIKLFLIFNFSVGEKICTQGKLHIQKHLLDLASDAFINLNKISYGKFQTQAFQAFCSENFLNENEIQNLINVNFYKNGKKMIDIFCMQMSQEKNIENFEGTIQKLGIEMTIHLKGNPIIINQNLNVFKNNRTIPKLGESEFTLTKKMSIVQHFYLGVDEFFRALNGQGDHSGHQSETLAHNKRRRKRSEFFLQPPQQPLQNLQPANLEKRKFKFCTFLFFATLFTLIPIIYFINKMSTEASDVSVWCYLAISISTFSLYAYPFVQKCTNFKQLFTNVAPNNFDEMP